MDGQTDRQTDRDRQRQRETDRETETERDRECYKTKSYDLALRNKSFYNDKMENEHIFEFCMDTYGFMSMM